MIENFSDLIRRIGGREAHDDVCPMCGRAVRPSQDSAEAWRGKLAHRDCVHYRVRRHARGSQRVHNRFTRP